MRLQLLGLIYSSCFLIISGCSSCTAQHDPSAERAQFKQESAAANKPKTALTEDFKLPEVPKGEEVAVADVGTAKFNSLCSSCHGAKGAGDGAASAGLNPKPRNFQDKAWQDSVTDDYIAKVIKEGGTAVGKSALMPPWGGVLNDADLAEVVKKVRGFQQ